MGMKSILIADAKQGKKKRLVVTDKMKWETLWKKVNEKMRYKEVTRIERKEDGVEMTAIKDLEDLKEYVSYGITWEEFNEQQERERIARERKEERLRRIREMRRLKAEREAKQVEDNEYEYTFWGDRLKLEYQAGSEGKNAVVTGFVNKATMLRYATLKRGDIITAVNDEVVLDLPFPEIETILFKAGMPVTLTVLSGRIDFTQRRAREYHDMLEAEVEIIDPFEMIWYEDKRQENDAMALFAAAKGNMVDDVRVRCEMEGANVNGRTIEGQTALHAAASEGHLQVMRLLFQHGADPNIADDNGMAPLHYAAQRGRSDLVRYLIAKGADILMADSQGRTPLLYAVSSGFRNTGQLLVRRGSDVFAYDKDWSWSPLHWAARRGDCVLVRTLCSVGCNAFQRSVRGLNAMQVALHHQRKGAAYELRQWYTRAASQLVLPEVDYGMQDEPPKDYEPPGAEEFVMPPPGGAATARSIETDRVSSSVAFNMPDVIQEDEEADEELERQLKRDRKGFKAGVAIGSGDAPVPGSVGVARTPEAIVKRVNAAGDGASATTEADAGLASVKAESWSLAQENFDDFMGELYIGDIDAARKEWAVARGFTAILTCQDSRYALPPHMDWLKDDAPDPPEPPPARRSAIIDRKRRSTIARRVQEARNDRRLSQLRAAALEREAERQRVAAAAAAANAGAGVGAGAGAGAGAGGGDADDDTVYDSADSGMDDATASGDDGEYSSGDEMEDRRVFVKPAHMVIQARDVDTVQGWTELLPHIPAACRFIHEQLRISAPPFSTDDDPAGSAKPGGRVLVQCRSGNQQAAIVVMAYMIVKMGFAPWKALNVCAYARPQITPPVTAVRGLCVLTERLIKREAKRREKRFVELRMASLAGV